MKKDFNKNLIITEEKKKKKKNNSNQVTLAGLIITMKKLQTIVMPLLDLEVLLI